MEWGKTKESFIFSFKNKNNFKDSILSHVRSIDSALFYHMYCGPAFSNDLYIGVEEDDDSKEYNFNICQQESYEKKIRDTEDVLSVEDYEVFQNREKRRLRL
ncbi:unnamed protein product [Rhizophagus irregularis]|nr:unnamed protein product [Rhizophagus irregularis]